MKKFLISLPENTIFEEYEAIELTHPKGKTVTFLHRNGEFFELHHFEHRSGAHSCFTECDEKNTVQSLAMIKAIKYDLRFLIIPILQKIESKGKISFSDLDIPETLRKACKRSEMTSKLEEMFDLKVLDDEIYIRFDQQKMIDHLTIKFNKLVETVKELDILPTAGPDRIRSYAAHLIKDCLSKDNVKVLDKALGLNQEDLKENHPPEKKQKLNSEASEDYSKGNNAASPKAEVKLTKKDKDLKNAAKGTKSMLSFFSPKPKK